MWPWEHAAIGYIAYSLLCRLRGEVPSDGAVIALLVGTQLPDLIDKPLAWEFGLLPSGRTLAHSLLFAVPVCLVVYLVARRSDRRQVGVAFGLGYLLHLPADVLAQPLYGAPLSLNFLLWPALPVAPSPPLELGCPLTVPGLRECLFGSLGIVFLTAEAALVGSAVYLWYTDQSPGLWRP